MIASSVTRHQVLACVFGAVSEIDAGRIVGSTRDLKLGPSRTGKSEEPTRYEQFLAHLKLPPPSLPNLDDPFDFFIVLAPKLDVGVISSVSFVASTFFLARRIIISSSTSNALYISKKGVPPWQV